VRSEEFAYLTALDLCRLIRTRQASPVEIVESALARLEAPQPALNAFVTVTADLRSTPPAPPRRR